MLHKLPQIAENYFVDDFFAEKLAAYVYQALCLEVQTFPKPGLVSHRDKGAHNDMDCTTFEKSAQSLQPFFKLFYLAGQADAPMAMLRCIGLKAESAMLKVTKNINTHKGAIFALGLICAAFGVKKQWNIKNKSLGAIIKEKWAKEILPTNIIAQNPIHKCSSYQDTNQPSQHSISNGEYVFKKYGAGGARLEAALGFPTLYTVGLPALKEARLLNPCQESQRVHVIMCLIATMYDTNLLYRGGDIGLKFAQKSAVDFLQQGSIAQKNWHFKAWDMHKKFIAKNLSPGGAADMLAATLLFDFLGEA